MFSNFMAVLLKIMYFFVLVKVHHKENFASFVIMRDISRDKYFLAFF
jgi:hypothetical protein